MNKYPLSRTAKYYQKVPSSNRHSGNIDIKELILYYKRHEYLWNFENIDYKNKSLKHQAWTRIAKHFGMPILDVKRKVKHLRSAYVSEKKKVDFSKRSGDLPEYQPNLFYYKYLNFLDNVVVWRKRNVDLELENVEISQEADNFLDFAKKEDIELNLPPEEELSPEPSPVPSLSPSPPPATPQQKQKISIPEIVSARSLSSRQPIRDSCRDYKSNRKINGVGVSSNHNLQQSVYTSFGTTIALQLQQLPHDVATETMSEIHLVLTKKILEYLKCEQNGENQSYSDVDDLIEVIKD